MGHLEPERRGKRSARRDISSGMALVFFVVGSLFNLLALLLLAGNVISLTRLWLSGAAVSLGGEMLAPLGAFLAGIICYLIANSFD